MSKSELMTPAQWDAFAKLAHLSKLGGGAKAARMVLVDGLPREEAAKQAKMTEGGLRVMLNRYRKLRSTIAQTARVMEGG